MQIVNDGSTQITMTGFVDELIHAKLHLMYADNKKPFAVLLSPEMYEQLWYRCADYLIDRPEGHRFRGVVLFAGLHVIVGNVPDGIQIVESPHEQAMRSLPNSILKGAGDRKAP